MTANVLSVLCLFSNALSETEKTMSSPHPKLFKRRSTHSIKCDKKIVNVLISYFNAKTMFNCKV